MTDPGLLACRSCGTQISASLLACPACNALTHADRLKQLVSEAEGAQETSDLSGAMAKWRAALDLLPEGTRQREAIEARVAALGEAIERVPAAGQKEPAQPQSLLRRSWAALAALFIFLLTKAKLLLLGLTKMGTLLSMLAFLGVYWSMWGWKFALGFVLGIYIHEMGHVAALRRYGIDASAPMFIPGIGALVRLRQHITDVRQDARVGLAGPLWGFAAALFAFVVGKATGSQLWLGIAQSLGFINLFNLMPVWQLDGGRGFHALNKWQRIAAAGVIALVWATSKQGLLIIILLLAVWQIFTKAPAEPDHETLGLYAVLIILLTWLATVPVTTTI